MYSYKHQISILKFSLLSTDTKTTKCSARHNDRNNSELCLQRLCGINLASLAAKLHKNT